MTIIAIFLVNLIFIVSCNFFDFGMTGVHILFGSFFLNSNILFFLAFLEIIECLNEIGEKILNIKK